MPVVRHARPDEIGQIIDLANRVFRADRTGDMAREFPLLLSADNAPNLCVVEADGRIVSHVGVLPLEARVEGVALTVAGIGGVCTDPAYRGRGLADAALGLAIDTARDRGDAWLIISGGRGLYLRRHALPFGPTHEMAVAAAALGQPAARAVADGDIEQIVALKNARPIGYQLDADTFARRLAVKREFGGDGWVHTDSSGRVDGWALLFFGGPLHGSLGASEAQLADWAGEPSAVAACCAAALADRGRGRLLVRLPWHERAIADHFAPRADRRQTLCRPGTTLQLPDPRRIVELFAERLAPLAPQAGRQSLALTVAGRHVELTDPAAIHHVLFTQPGHWPAGVRIDADATALAPALPIPVPDYGMCYV